MQGLRGPDERPPLQVIRLSQAGTLRRCDERHGPNLVGGPQCEGRLSLKLSGIRGLAGLADASTDHWLSNRGQRAP